MLLSYLTVSSAAFGHHLGERKSPFPSRVEGNVTVQLPYDSEKLLPLLPLALATPTPLHPSISVDTFADKTCTLPSVRGYIFTKNNTCRQFIEAEGSFTAISINGPAKKGCVLQVFADTNCENVVAAITIDGRCEAPFYGPASSGMVVGC